MTDEQLPDESHWVWPTEAKFREMTELARTLCDVVMRDHHELLDEGIPDKRTLDRLMLELQVAAQCCYLIELIRRRVGIPPRADTPRV